MQGSAGSKLKVSFGEHVRVEREAGALRISANGRLISPAIDERVLEQLAGGGLDEDDLIKDMIQSGDTAALFSVVGALHMLDSRGLLHRRVVTNDCDLAALIPTSGRFRFDKNHPDTNMRVKLSRFAYMRAHEGLMSIESPLGHARVVVFDPRAADIVLTLATGQLFEELKSAASRLEADAIKGLLTLLWNAAALVDADDPEQPTGAKAASDWWEFHDLLFHMRSRRGRHNAPYGGTFPHNSIAAAPLVKPRRDGKIIKLARPDLEVLRRTDPPFSDVLERRRSLRTYGEEPLSVEQLGEFLYRCARYQSVPAAEQGEYAYRPAPAGGALHELEIYPVVANCRGLEPGVYHYRPLEHELTHIAGASPQHAKLLDEAWRTASRKSPLQVYFHITARCQRVFWKYQSMAYALILKNLGVMYATMYLVGTAMDLAPCALGGGDSELFASVAGLDPCEEPAVGEFALGTKRKAPANA